MAGQLACGRTLPRRGKAVGAELSDLVRNVCGHDRRVEPFHPVARGPGGARGESVEFHFFARPLPPIRLPDGTYPFVVDLGASEDVYSGSLPLEGPSDALVERLWDTCRDARPLRAGLGLALQTPEICSDVSVQLDMMRHDPEMRAILHLNYVPREGEADAARRFLAAVGLDHLATPEQLDPTGIGATRTVLMTDLPAEPSLLLDFTRGLERLGWTSPDVVTRAHFLAVDSPLNYMKLRGRLNALAGGWYCEIPGWYRDGFDPFIDPPEPPAGEEYRYPVAAYVKQSRTTGEHPTIQIDVVHAQEGTFLEFQSAEGPRQVRRYADLAGAEIEMWAGPAADRWVKVP